VTKKERTAMDNLCTDDVCRIVRKKAKERGYDISIDEIKLVFEIYVDIIYTCLLNGIRVTLFGLGEFYRDIKKGRKAGYYNVPNSRDDHTAFDKNMTWHKEWMEKAPDWGKIKFVEYPRVKNRFKNDTLGKVNG